ncbi:hypothetical protein CGMCC3_g6116 [Colletotrichum fructicola]|nr:uncharacterized protein CGMCC3_g6116 [Colletotrichum fructicola]KAE9577777.1 hypothetical protein CGMCC3_g6116 [Colletotrichum fructicola]
MKLFSIIVAAITLATSVAAKDCCCTIVNTGACNCIGPYEETTNCAQICSIRGSTTCTK